jgi:hypothetical protein
MVKGSLSKPLAATAPSGRFALVAMIHDCIWYGEAARSVVPRCCEIVYTGIQRVVAACGTRRFPAGTVSSRAVSAGANGKVHTAGVQDTSTSEEMRCRALSHAAEVVVNRWRRRGGRTI